MLLSLHESNTIQSCLGPLSFEILACAVVSPQRARHTYGWEAVGFGSPAGGGGRSHTELPPLLLPAQFRAVSSCPISRPCAGLPTRVAQTRFRAASLCLPTYLQLGELELLFLVICKKSLSLDGVVCAFIDLVTGTTEAFPSPGCMISARALEQGPALAAGVFPVLLT